ncbi:MAG: PulJ/GspJ family protein [Geminicoccales bacterium]
MSGSLVGNGERGFTLMELLVATTLLGILMVALFGGLRLGTRVWEVSDRTLAASEEKQAIRNFLRSRFEQALPIASGNQTEPLFKGTGTSLSFASVMPISLGADLFLMELVLKPRPRSDGIRDLVLRWRPIGTTNEIGADDVVERIMIEDVAGLTLQYFGAEQRTSPAAWTTNWHDQESLPSLIKVELQFAANDQRDWQPLIVSPRIDVWYDTVF